MLKDLQDNDLDLILGTRFDKYLKALVVQSVICEKAWLRLFQIQPTSWPSKFAEISVTYE